MIVPRDVDVQHVEAIQLAKVIGEIYEARRSRFRNTVVNHHDVFIEVIMILGRSRVEQRQKVVCERFKNR